MLQGVGSDVLVRDPGLPNNLTIIPRVPIVKVTSSRTKLHLAATRALAAREDVRSFGLTLPSPTTDLELQELMTWTWPRLTSLDIQQVGISESSHMMIVCRFLMCKGFSLCSMGDSEWDLACLASPHWTCSLVRNISGFSTMLQLAPLLTKALCACRGMS